MISNTRLFSVVSISSPPKSAGSEESFSAFVISPSRPPPISSFLKNAISSTSGVLLLAAKLFSTASSVSRFEVVKTASATGGLVSSSSIVTVPVSLSSCT